MRGSDSGIEALFVESAGQLVRWWQTSVNLLDFGRFEI